MMAEDATPLVEALLTIIDAGRAYLPTSSSPGCSRRLTMRELSPRSPLMVTRWPGQGGFRTAAAVRADNPACRGGGSLCATRVGSTSSCRRSCCIGGVCRSRGCEGLRQQIDVDVCGAAAIGA
jgi:hypothetical protein